MSRSSTRLTDVFGAWRDERVGGPARGTTGLHVDAVDFVEFVCQTLDVTAKDLHAVAKRLRDTSLDREGGAS
jgi:hypothetical protein